MASKYIALLYSAFATRSILCFLSLHKQHFVTAHSEFITAHFAFHCTLKNALLPVLEYSLNSDSGGGVERQTVTPGLFLSRETEFLKSFNLTSCMGDNGARTHTHSLACLAFLRSLDSRHRQSISYWHHHHHQ